MVTSELEGKILESLSEAKEKFEKLKKEAKNPYFKSNYSDLNALLDMIVPVLSECGIDVYQPLNVIETTEGSVVDILQTVLECDDGSRLVSTTKLGEYEDIQKKGAAVTYLRRYMLKTLLALQDEDDDGETASGRGSSFGGKKTPSSTGGKGRGKKKEDKEPDKKQEESGDSFTGRGRGRGSKKKDDDSKEEASNEEAPKEEKKPRGRGRSKKEEEPAEEEKKEESGGRRRRGRGK